MGFPILSSILLCPVAGLLAILLIPRSQVTLIRVAALLAAGATLVLSLVLLSRFDSQVADLQFVERVSWIPGMGIDYALGVDGLSITMVLLTSIVIFCG